MRFHADLHVHSKYSRATSGDCDLPHLSYWARRKGIAVVGTGDFTHPAWRAALRESLVPAEPGLYRLRADIERAVGERLEAGCRGATRFLLSVEISTIYKKGERTRKVHHLVYVPDFEAAERLVLSLSRVGNLASDGRPILGLDSRHLLEAVLESGEGSYLVPAHIWTPWFSVLGSKAGFDAVDACYGDLASHIFALETGLSSDPAMNWRLSALDRYRLISSSDAHSPPKLGREATLFDVPLDYFAIRRALETGEGLCGTVEFFPEEGKYHLDGHRKCQVSLEPSETRARGEACPVCGQGLTVGVLHRVEELSDRAEGERPPGAAGYQNLVPLPEVLSELEGVGAGSKAVQRAYDGLLSRLGPELYILEEAPLVDIERAGTPLLAEAVRRMREGRVIRQAGYDGEYGVIRMFEPSELRRRLGVRLLFEDAAGASPLPSPATPSPAPAPAVPNSLVAPAPPDRQQALFAEAGVASAAGRGESSLLAALDPDQRAAAEVTEGPLLIVAGPGTGKTRTLTHRIAHLVADKGVLPEQCLAITFTRRAADEMRERLRALLGEAGDRVPAMTFHALGLSMLREHAGGDGGGPFGLASERERAALLSESLGVSERAARKLLAEIARCKRLCPRRAGAAERLSGALDPGGEVDRAWAVYEAALEARRLWDFDDLVGLAVELLEERPDVVAAMRARFRYVSIDEYQDVDERQYRLVRALVPPGGNVCAIGDPDQAIYGFRGADVGFFLRFQEDHPSARVVRLRRNYRSTHAVVEAALQVVAPSPTLGKRELFSRADDGSRIALHEAATARAEAELVVHTIERMIGGSTFFSMDSGRVTSAEARTDFSFSDFAILFRTDAQSEALREALARSGMPFQRRSHGRLAERAVVEALVQAVVGAPPGLPVLERLKAAAAELRERIAQPTDAGTNAGTGTDTDTETVAVAANGSLTESDVDAALELVLPLSARCGHDLDRFLLELWTAAEVDTWDPRADRISLLTLHASKGLEFPVVFLVGCEDGLVPLRFPGREDVDLDEERRLLFVGITRARCRLILTHARERRRGGQVVRAALSPFLHEIDARLFELPEPARPARAAAARRQLKLF